MRQGYHILVIRSHKEMSWSDNRESSSDSWCMLQLKHSVHWYLFAKDPITPEFLNLIVLLSPNPVCCSYQSLPFTQNNWRPTFCMKCLADNFTVTSCCKFVIWSIMLSVDIYNLDKRFSQHWLVLSRVLQKSGPADWELFA